ncbi:PiggyBac transposable element-derived protein 2 [Araneus ventricosus]|uniref:PiggyBac transposable element-derived protein 2 n=1 Tax=Araneus ventricosus TaxID=182803 RepID=A0A4Y2E2J2_ARAVE|nr:PiggyBac transposable element-derived protein 2 [Araneus ventricosus]
MKYLNLKDPKVHAEILAFITDEMAENSDLEGDEDPDDALPDQTTPNDISFQDMEESFHSSDDDALPCEVTENPVIMDEEDNPDESDLEAFDITWEKKLTPPKSFSSYQLCQNYGNAVTVDSDAPHLIFSLFFTSTFMNLIVEQSNLYASQHHANLDLTIEELKDFFGLLIVMGFNKLPSLRLYWSKDLNFASQRIMDVMPLKRFLKILRFLHLNDNTRMPLKGQFGYDKLYKVRPLFEQLNTTFHHAFNPSRCISIDESMVKFKGRSSLKQYMPLKPIKRGFKVCVAACANTGYCLSMSVYTGKEEKAGTSKMSLGEQVVSQLTHLFKGKGYCLFFDNFFSNVSMMSSLLQQNFFCCGTIQQRRKFFPKSYMMDDKQMKTVDSDFACSEEISVVKWRDRGKKSVLSAPCTTPMLLHLF